MGWIASCVFAGLSEKKGRKRQKKNRKTKKGTEPLSTKIITVLLIISGEKGFRNKAKSTEPSNPRKITPLDFVQNGAIVLAHNAFFNRIYENTKN